MASIAHPTPETSRTVVAASMTWATIRRAVSWVVPEGVLLGAAVASLRLGELRVRAQEFAPFYPLLVFGLGILLALRFQRSRLVFALLSLAIVEWALGNLPGGPSGRFVLQAMATLLPLNLAAIALMTERGTLTRPGLLRLCALLAQVVAVAALANYPPFPAGAVASYRPLPASWFAWTPLNQFAVMAFVVAAALMAGAMVLQATGTARAFLWALGASFLASQSARTGLAATIYLSTAGLILVVAVIEASYLMAYQDSLTGLPARRALNEALQRVGGRFTIAMVDVDHFKKLNDRHGHDVGDQVLRMVGSRLSKVANGGRAFRYGGEEFAILFAGKDVKECLAQLETLRRSIEQSRFTLRRRLRPRRKQNRSSDGESGAVGRKQITVTVSIGAAEPNGRQLTPDQVIQAADRALYRAKDGGRNRVES